MEDYNLLDYNRHQLMKRALTLLTRPILVFLAPTMKGLRSPILKCKIPLASLMPISDCHQSVAHQPLFINTAGQSLLNTIGQSLSACSILSSTPALH